MLKFTRIIKRFNSYATEPLLIKKSPKEVAQRVCCTHLLLTRSVLESMDTPENEMANRVLLDSIEKSDVKGWMTSRETELLGKKFKTWDYATDIYETHNRWESLGILLWALRILREIPEYGTYFPKQDMFKATAIIPAFPDTITTFVEYFDKGEGSKPDHFCSELDFKNSISIAEAWHWRAKAQLVLDFKKSLEVEGNTDKISDAPKELKNVMKHIEQAIQLGTERAIADRLILESKDNDFKVGEKAYKSLDDHGLRDVGNISESRLAALGWIAGTHEWEYDRGDLHFINPLGSLWNPE